MISNKIIKKYGIEDICFMGFYKTNDSGFTYHHIIKHVYTKYVPKDIYSGAILTRWAHYYLHLIENKEIEAYTELNNIFREIIKQEKAPTFEQYLKVELLLRQFETLYENTTNNKGEPLLRLEHKNRLLINYNV